MRLLLFLIACMLTAPASIVASPAVSDFTILWPADGRYQVQYANDYTSVCEGGSSCEKPSGTYTIINHTTGERYTGIVVSARPMSTGVTMEGNTLAWPDDGWYQVRNAENYNTVCEGGRSCTVAAATYIVINHTSGYRFENVVVSVVAGPVGDAPTPLIDVCVPHYSGSWNPKTNIRDVLSTSEDFADDTNSNRFMKGVHQ